MYVYAIRSESNPPHVKIGKATDVKHRLSALQVSSPFELRLVGSVLCWTDEKSLEVEAKAHRDLRKHKASGEWFAWVPEVEQYITELLKMKVPQPRKRGEPFSGAIAVSVKSTPKSSLDVDLDRMIMVTNPEEIEAVRRGLETGDLDAPIGSFVGSTCVAYRWSLERYRQGRTSL